MVLRAAIALTIGLGCALPARAAEVTVPINIGVGPTANMFTGPIQNEQLFHYGLRFELAGVIDKETLKKNKNKIPAKYRKQLSKVSEVRYNPYIWIPNALFISPKVAGLNHTGMYGINWRPLALGISLINQPVRLTLNAGLNVTYIFMHSETLFEYMHFVRPGIDAKAELEIPFSDSFLISLGWASHFYPPQRVGGLPWDFSGGITDSVWHVGQTFLLFHFRFPYTANL